MKKNKLTEEERKKQDIKQLNEDLALMNCYMVTLMAVSMLVVDLMVFSQGNLNYPYADGSIFHNDYIHLSVRVFFVILAHALHMRARRIYRANLKEN